MIVIRHKRKKLTCCWIEVAEPTTTTYYSCVLFFGWNEKSLGQRNIYVLAIFCRHSNSSVLFSDFELNWKCIISHFTSPESRHYANIRIKDHIKQTRCFRVTNHINSTNRIKKRNAKKTRTNVCSLLLYKFESNGQKTVRAFTHSRTEKKNVNEPKASSDAVAIAYFVSFRLKLIFFRFLRDHRELF